jgi:Family of unknown function (DUF6325)
LKQSETTRVGVVLPGPPGVTMYVVTGGSGRRRRASPVATDLVEYIVVVVPDLESVVTVAPALTEMVNASTIRLLDLVVIGKSPDGEVDVLEMEAVDSLRELGELEGEVGGLLSDHDVELISLALSPGTAGVVVVTEDYWAEPLSLAARRVGGRILAGERIPTARVEAALADSGDE